MSDYAGKVAEVIRADVRMISGCDDHQTSADVGNVSQFELPDPAGRSGGACTSALLNVLYKDHMDTSEDLSFVEVLTKMRGDLSSGRFTQIPQLSSSRQIDIHTPFTLVPSGSRGTRRAVLIGINYVGQKGQLSGCHNDVLNIKQYIMRVHGFEEENIQVLMDDGRHTNPTRRNITSALVNLTKQSQAGDCVFVHYSGHGGNVPDDNGDEEDGRDETLIPVDFQRAGQIRDDELLEKFVIPMAAGVTVTCLMDCCHSGTILDLPYVFQADGKQSSTSMKQNSKFDFGKVGGIAMSVLPAAFAAFSSASATGGSMMGCMALCGALTPLVTAVMGK